jgi:hypothetical protein
MVLLVALTSVGATALEEDERVAAQAPPPTYDDQCGDGCDNDVTPLQARCTEAQRYSFQREQSFPRHGKSASTGWEHPASRLCPRLPGTGPVLSGCLVDLAHNDLHCRRVMQHWQGRYLVPRFVSLLG